MAARLQEIGRQAWIVGGAVRDLALGIPAQDVDLATDAHPSEVERLFERTAAVGKAFGTVIVLGGEREVQVTTFRTERGYSDARRPDEVTFGTSVAEDAARRDFTCNAMYLGPTSDELHDPTGGLSDLGAGRLVCVGDATERFREDGLRLLRLARFAAAFGLEVDEETRAAAQASVGRVVGVSAERLHGELVRVAAGREPGRALRLLEEIDVLRRILPGVELDVPAVERLGPEPGPVRMLAALLRGGRRAQALEGLRPSRDERARVEAAWSAEDALRELARREDGGSRSELVLFLREPGFEDGLALLRARVGSTAEDGLEPLLALRASLPAAKLRPEPFLTSQDLARSGVSPGPAFGALLAEAERLQLDLVLADRAAALRWLEERLQRPGDARRASASES